MIKRKDENTSIQVSKLTKNKLKDLKHSFKVESLEDVIRILLESRKDVEKQVIYTRKKIRNICDKDESLYTYFEDVDDMLANCLNIIDDDYYELEKGDENMNRKIEQKREEIEEVKEEIENYGFFIEKVNPDNVWELEEEEFNEVLKGLNQEIIEQIKEHEIPLFYTKLGNFYPFLEGEPTDFLEFLENYKEELRDWYKREEDFFMDYESAETIYHIYCELFDMEDEEVDSWYDNEFDSCSWRSVYLSKANGTVFLIDAGGYGDDIAIIDPESDVNNIVKRLKEGEPLHKILQ